MLLPELFIYPIALLVGIPIVMFASSGFDGLKAFFSGLKSFIVNLPIVLWSILKNISRFPSFIFIFIKSIPAIPQKVKSTKLSFRDFGGFAILIGLFVFMAGLLFSWHEVGL